MDNSDVHLPIITDENGTNKRWQGGRLLGRHNPKIVNFRTRPYVFGLGRVDDGVGCLGGKASRPTMPPPHMQHTHLVCAQIPAVGLGTGHGPTCCRKVSPTFSKSIANLDPARLCTTARPTTSEVSHYPGSHCPPQHTEAYTRDREFAKVGSAPTFADPRNPPTRSHVKTSQQLFR